MRPLVLLSDERQEDRSLSRATQAERFESTFGQAAGAAFRQNFDFSPGPSAFRMLELNDAQDTEDTRLLDERLAEPFQPARRLDAEEWIAGPHYRDGLKYPSGGYTEEAAKLIAERHDRQKVLDFLQDRGPDGFAGAGAFGVGVLGGAIDPLSIASAFVPVVREARMAAWAARYGTTGARLMTGAVEGAVGNAALEPLVLANARMEQSDYTMTQSLVNVGFGAAFGSGLHVGIGGAGDLVGRLRARTREDAFRGAVAQVVDERPVDVDAALRGDPHFELDDDGIALLSRPAPWEPAASPAPGRVEIDIEPRAQGRPAIEAVREDLSRPWRERSDVRDAFVAVEGRVAKRRVARSMWADFEITRDGSTWVGAGTRAEPMRRVSGEELEALVTSAAAKLDATRGELSAARDRFTGDAREIAEAAAEMGLSARLVAPADTSSRYVYVKLPDGSEVKIRVADHPQPKEFARDPETGASVYRLVGGFSQALGRRHAAADFSIDPSTKDTAEGVIGALRRRIEQDEAQPPPEIAAARSPRTLGVAEAEPTPSAIERRGREAERAGAAGKAPSEIRRRAEKAAEEFEIEGSDVFDDQLDALRAAGRVTPEDEAEIAAAAKAEQDADGFARAAEVAAGCMARRA